MIENLKARFYGQKFDIYHEELVESKWYDWAITNYWCYNKTIYYGMKWFVFIYSAQNAWFKDRKYKFV